jgi:hypothetical protein
MTPFVAAAETTLEGRGADSGSTRVKGFRKVEVE